MNVIVGKCYLVAPLNCYTSPAQYMGQISGTNVCSVHGTWYFDLWAVVASSCTSTGP